MTARMKFPPEEPVIAPSILTADFSRMGNQLRELEECGVRMLHLDIMDGHFVPNISFGPHVVSTLRKRTGMMFDVHLMISSPLDFVDEFARAGADIITVHLEAADSGGVPVEEIYGRIRSHGIKTGLSVNPKTPVEDVYPWLGDTDMVLIMTVEPGFGGQGMIQSAVGKIPVLREHIKKNRINCAIEVDGGVNDSTAAGVARAGADVLVCGSVIFREQKIRENYGRISGIISGVKEQ